MQIFPARAVVLEKDSIEERETRHAGSKFFHRRHSPGVDRVSFSNVVVLCLRPLKKGEETRRDIIFFIFFLLRHFIYVKEKKNSLYEQHLLIPLFHEDFVELSIARKN